jgi:hypothetical protein
MKERKKEGLGFLLFKRVDDFELCHGWLVLPSFDLFHRKNPFGGEYTVFAGLEECIRFAANYHFKEDEISFLRSVLPSTCEVSRYMIIFFFLSNRPFLVLNFSPLLNVIVSQLLE